MNVMPHRVLHGRGRRADGVLRLLILLLVAFTTGRALGAQEGVNLAYRRLIVAPALRAARVAWCRRIRAEWPPMARDDSEHAQDEAEWASGQLSLKQADCAYLGAFYRELRYAAVHHVLGRGAWRSCRRLAPVDDMHTALQVAIYLQCLQRVWGSPVCRSVRSASRALPTSGPYAACARLLGSNDWSQWGESAPRGTPRSLFASAAALRRRSVGARSPIFALPTSATLSGWLLTGFSLGCCDFGMGYNWPTSFLRLDAPRRMSQSGWVVDLPVRRIRLDRRAPKALLGKRVLVHCASLWFPATETGIYCRVQWIRSANRGSARAASSVSRRRSQ